MFSEEHRRRWRRQDAVATFGTMPPHESYERRRDRLERSDSWADDVLSFTFVENTSRAGRRAGSPPNFGTMPPAPKERSARRSWTPPLVVRRWHGSEAMPVGGKRQGSEEVLRHCATSIDPSSELPGCHSTHERCRFPPTGAREGSTERSRRCEDGASATKDEWSAERSDRRHRRGMDADKKR